MKRMSERGVRVGVMVVMLLSVCGRPAHADLYYGNGDFESGGTDWTVVGDAFFEDGEALLFPPGIETVSSIEQRFDLLADEAWVVFDLGFFVEGGMPPETDCFDAILRTAGGTEHVIYNVDSTEGTFEETISAPIPGSLLPGSDYTLIFRLTSDLTDDVETSVAIDNVHTAAVPVPPALALGALGLCTSLVGCVRQRRSRS